MPARLPVLVVTGASLLAAVAVTPHRAAAQRALERVQVTGKDVCDADTVGADPLALATLWNEAREVAARSAAFHRQHRFTYARRSTVTAERMKASVPGDTVFVMAPRPADSLATQEPVADRLGSVRRRWFGARATATIVLPSERVLLSEDFLREHCFAPRVERTGDGSRQLVFASRYGRKTGLEVEGTLTFGPEVAELQRFDLRYRGEKRLLGQSSRTYAPLVVDGRTVMLSREATLQMGDSADAKRPWFRWRFTEERRDIQRVP